jgi:hypothetical protein
MHMRSLAAVVVLVFLGGCASCSKPSQVTDSGTPDAGCDGLVGCACVAGACTTGECVGGTCTSCQRGAGGCVCRANGTCDVGQQCDAGLCSTCPGGTNGCPCNSGDTCNTGLTCASGTCVPNNCTDGANGCPCRTTGMPCDGTMYCDGTMRCQNCTSDVPGCPCDPGNTCMAGLVCASGTTTCRAAVSCNDLADAGTCLPHQACKEQAGSDAVCLAGMCSANFKWDSVAMMCVPCVSMGCTMEPDCTPGGMFAQTCATQNRACTTNGMVAACGSCLSGFTDSMGTCIPEPTCGTSADGGAVTCTATQFCDLSSGTPTCAALPCAPGQAKGTTGTCISCPPVSTCSPDAGAGLSGRWWPVTTAGDQCICETLDGYFLPAGSNTQAELCDADHDGWVRKDAYDALSSDPATRANSRCAIRMIDRVRLADEYGEFLDVLSCNIGLVATYPDAGTACPMPKLLPLVESLRNDVPGTANAMTLAPPYGGAPGRLLNAAELNSLTKACVQSNGDYNDDGHDDGTWTQSYSGATDFERFVNSFSYFMELYTSWFEPTSGPTTGRLWIAERSRCAPDFPLRYDTGSNPDMQRDLYDAGTGMTYWRNCSRGIDPKYNSSVMNVPGFDFAQYTCATANTGTVSPCPIVPPAHAIYTAPVDAGTVLLRNFGLCELNGVLPADRRWRGLLHASQFKCVNVTTGTKMTLIDHDTSEFSAAGPGSAPLTFESCHARQCDGGVACSTKSGPQGSPLLQSQVPSISCTATGSPAAGLFGFAALNYNAYGPASLGYPKLTYQGGCINEDSEYGSYVCPFPQFSLDPTAGPNAFGRYSCYGKGQNYLWCCGDAGADISTLYWNGPLGPDGGPTNPTNSVLRGP